MMRNTLKKAAVIIEALRSMFRKPLFIFVTVGFSGLLFVLFIFLNNVPSFLSVMRISLDPGLLFKVFVNQVSMIASISGTFFIVSLVAIAFLGGVNIALLLYKRKIARAFRSQGKVTGAAGVFGGALASACPACSGSLLSVLGVSSGIAVFPLKGFEFIALSFLLLIASLYSTSKKIGESNACCKIP